MAIPEILMIEDRVDDRELFSAAVAASGLRATVVHAVDASQAVMRVNRLGRFANLPQPALIVLDLGLPGLQGQALLEAIRKAYGLREVPVVVLTGSQLESDRAACRSWGVSDYLVKQESFEKLVEWVRTLARFLPGQEGIAAAPSAGGAPLPPSAPATKGKTP
ncbi:MAG: response regulator [Planctomycetes bacterium]|nr:response regulator [Planctomycetota bacterium]